VKPEGDGEAEAEAEDAPAVAAAERVAAVTEHGFAATAIVVAVPSAGFVLE
jgi:hypothetical protein